MKKWETSPSLIVSTSIVSPNMVGNPRGRPNGQRKKRGKSSNWRESSRNMWFNGDSMVIQWWFNGLQWDLLGYMMVYPLVNIQKTIENGHRNSGFTHKKMVIFQFAMWMFTRGYLEACSDFPGISWSLRSWLEKMKASYALNISHLQIVIPWTSMDHETMIMFSLNFDNWPW